ncbi:MAG: hypothetical protein E7578_05190 [Ruminococcaceae bacterium]|nr:hypothetical protein [Oscillospiraceae bacterium]
MYLIKTEVGRGYSVEYPEFEGYGCGMINGFYLHLAECVREYFEALVKEDRHNICRCRFSVDGSEDTVAVTVALTLRRGGKKLSEKALIHRWRLWMGKGWAITT